MIIDSFSPSSASLFVLFPSLDLGSLDRIRHVLRVTQKQRKIRDYMMNSTARRISRIISSCNLHWPFLDSYFQKCILAYLLYT